MSKQKRTTVASGVIGEYSHEWAVVQVCDQKYNSETYELFIGEERIASAASVVEALAVLVDEFS